MEKGTSLHLPLPSVLGLFHSVSMTNPLMWSLLLTSSPFTPQPREIHLDQLMSQIMLSPFETE
jgi:hypothetical protein